MSERLIMLIVWSLCVAAVVFIGMGFANSPEEAFTADNWLLWGIIASPVIPLGLWLKERSRADH